MRTIITSTGADIALDGDLLAIIETLFQEVTARRELDRSYEDMMREIRHLISQMTDDERSDYLAESLFHNTVRFENDRLASYMEQLATAPAVEPTGLDAPPTRSPKQGPKRAAARPAKRAAKRTRTTSKTRRAASAPKHASTTAAKRTKRPAASTKRKTAKGRRK